VLVVNPDVRLDPCSIARMHRALHDPGVGMVVPRVLDDDGALYPSLRREPSPSRAVGEALFGARWPGRPGWLAEIVRSRMAYETPHDVAWAGGAVMLIGGHCHRAVGDWDERFFLYSEETDFARRVRGAGYRVRYVPMATARHVDGGSGRSPALAALLAVNRVRYYEKYHGRPASSLFRCAVAVHHLLRWRQADSRAALAALCRRSRWAALPGSPSRSPVRPGHREQVVAVTRQHP
jgi:GT2 family glycosyltransferase